jgi:hypothetical protein
MLLASAFDLGHHTQSDMRQALFKLCRAEQFQLPVTFHRAISTSQDGPKPVNRDHEQVDPYSDKKRNKEIGSEKVLGACELVPKLELLLARSGRNDITCARPHLAMRFVAGSRTQNPISGTSDLRNQHADFHGPRISTKLRTCGLILFFTHSFFSACASG